MAGRSLPALAAVAVAATALAAGCGYPKATIEYMTGGVETVQYDSATFQLARDSKIQIILFRRTAAPLGAADSDFEYVYMELPERRRYGWVRQDRMPVYRWVREGGRDHLWWGVAGQVGLRPGDLKQHMHMEFRTTMEPIAGTAGGSYFLRGNVRLLEDAVVTQGLINRYNDWLATLLRPKAAPAGKAKPQDAGGPVSPPTPPAATPDVARPTSP